MIFMEFMWWPFLWHWSLRLEFYCGSAGALWKPVWKSVWKPLRCVFGAVTRVVGSCVCVVHWGPSYSPIWWAKALQSSRRLWQISPDSVPGDFHQSECCQIWPRFIITLPRNILLLHLYSIFTSSLLCCYSYIYSLPKRYVVSHLLYLNLPSHTTFEYTCFVDVLSNQLLVSAWIKMEHTPWHIIHGKLLIGCGVVWCKWSRSKLTFKGAMNFAS